MANRHILLLFGSNPVSYNVASAFLDSDYSITCFIPKNEKRIFSYSNRFEHVGFSNYSWNDKRYVDELIRYLTSLNISGKILVFLTNDKSVSFWINNHKSLSQYCTVQTENLEPFYNKKLFFNAIRSLEIDHPKTWHFTENSNEAFPFLVKPAYKDANDSFLKIFNSKVKIIKNSADLSELHKFDPHQLICQEILDFHEGDEFSWWGYRNTSGNILSLTARHMSKYPDKTGRISNICMADKPEVKELGDEIVEKLNYTGIADIQFIFDKKANKYKVTEMNPRIWCSHELLLMNDMNLIRLCADDYYRGPDSDTRKPYLDGLKKVPEKQWFSVLYNIGNSMGKKVKNTEFYRHDTDNLHTRFVIYLFLLVKKFYYKIKFHSHPGIKL